MLKKVIYFILITTVAAWSISCGHMYSDLDDYTNFYKNTYTVSYNGNGNISGTEPVDGNRYIIGDTVTVLGNTGDLRGQLIEAGITQRLTGWNTEANGSGAPYTFGDPLVMGAGDITLYAQWTIDASVIRKIGPAGGYVFYDKGSYSDTPPWRYLEAAPDDLGVTLWGNCSEIPDDQTSTVIGAGFQNTIEILAVDPSDNPTEAAHLCDAYLGGGYADWFLPSYAELYQMHQELYSYGVRNFKTIEYWSSSEMWVSTTFAIHVLIFEPSPWTGYWQGQDWALYYVLPTRRF